MSAPAMDIAIIGTRGLPATWGGVERHVEEIGARLVERGHHVTVFTRPGYSDHVGDHYRGMRLREVRSVPGRGVEALVHSMNAVARTVGRGYDVVHFHAVGPALVSPLARAFTRAGIVQTVHGLDGERDKWGSGERLFLRAGTWVSARVPHRTIVVSRDLQRHYRDTYGRRTDYIPNGVTPVVGTGALSVEAAFGVQPGRYLLYVGRLVPEKASDVLVRAFGMVPGDLRLVIAGGSSDTNDYVAEVTRLAARDPRIVMAGFVYGDDLVSLYQNALGFVLPSLLEGLPITLLEAASHRLPLVVSSIPPHLEVVGQERPGVRLAEPGSTSSLADAIARSVQDHASEALGAKAIAEDIMKNYDWDAVTEATESVYQAAADRARRRA